MKTLYITDLDGTLLTADENISEYTARTVNSLINSGVCFSYATARPYAAAGKITACLTAPFPVILYNGVFIMDNATGRVLKSNFMTDSVACSVLDTLTTSGVYPLVYHYTGGHENVSWVEAQATEEMTKFLTGHQGDLPRMPAEDKAGLYHSNIYYITCIGSAEKLLPLYTALKDNPHINAIYQQDIYSGRQWLEIMPAAASKANAILQLKEMLGCDKVICFGDGKNDLSMFAIADECYAVANAVDRLKEKATAVIAANSDDGVARWLAENTDI